MDKLTGIISSAELMGGQIVGLRGLKGDKGDTGNGIASIAKTGTSGDIDTYTITFTDGDTTTFTVTNGHTPVITQIPVATELWTGTAIYVDGVYLTTIMDGAKGDKGDTGATGATGNGISSITLTDTTGSVKTYTITFTNGNTTTFQVTDGEVTNAFLEQVLPTDSASGSVASFPDGTDLFPALSVVADIDPIQDLHGYDAPWVGGAGKNKLPYGSATYTANNVTFTRNDDGTIKVKTNGSATALTDYYFVGASATYESFNIATGTYKFVCTDANIGSAQTLFCVEEGGNVIGSISSGAYVSSTFSLDATKKYRIMLRIPNGGTVDVTYKLMLVESSVTDYTYSPYENLCPISGWSGVDVARCGINVWDEVAEVGGLNVNTGATTVANRTRSKNYIPCVPNTSYYWKLPSSSGLAVCYYDASKTFVSGAWVFENQAHTTPANAYFMKFGTGDAYGTTYNNDISINYPSTDHDYHAYNGTTYTVSWSGDAGTVYGGTVDVVSGELTVKYIKQTITSFSGAWGAVTNGYAVYVSANDTVHAEASDSAFMKSSMFSFYEGSRGTAPLGSYGGNNGADTVQTFILPPTITSLNDANTWLSNQADDLDVTFKLATPTTYTLTPAQVDLLVGQNTVFADTGDVEVEYKADIQRYIAKKLAE